MFNLLCKHSTLTNKIQLLRHMSCWSDHSIIWIMTVLPSKHYFALAFVHYYWSIVINVHNLLVSRILLLRSCEVSLLQRQFIEIKKVLCVVFPLHWNFRLQMPKRLIDKWYLFWNYIVFSSSEKHIFLTKTKDEKKSMKIPKI